MLYKTMSLLCLFFDVCGAVKEEEVDTVQLIQFQTTTGDGSVQLVERRTRDRKVAGSIQQVQRGELFSSPELTFCVNSYSVFVPAPCYRSGT